MECKHVIKREEITTFCRATNNNSEVRLQRFANGLTFVTLNRILLP